MADHGEMLSLLVKICWYADKQDLGVHICNCIHTINPVYTQFAWKVNVILLFVAFTAIDPTQIIEINHQKRQRDLPML